jgi:hypothetical protein
LTAIADCLFALGARDVAQQLVPRGDSSTSKRPHADQTEQISNKKTKDEEKSMSGGLLSVIV